MILIAGLGNPGEKYAATRHNVGFMALDRLAEEFGVTFEDSKKFKAQIAKVDSSLDNKIVLAKPQTFMNCSGEAIKALAKFYEINYMDIWVIHDELDIDLGKLRIRKGGSSGGQKGVQSVIDQLGTPEFVRFRVGIKPESGTCKSAEEFVLGKFRKEERETINEEIEKIVEIVKTFIQTGVEEITV